MTSKILASIAAAGLAFAPIAAQANTRAGDAGVSFQDIPHHHFLPNEEELVAGWPWEGVLLGLIILGGVVFAIGGDTSEGNDASPGTGG